jgi:DNA primase
VTSATGARAGGTAAEVKARLGVVDVVGESVALKRAGTAFKGLCPFHAEKTPSFIVSPDRGTWHCFGCGQGGDIFSFVMRRDGVEFREALTSLAAKAGVELSARGAREDRRRARLRDALEAAFTFYREILLDPRMPAAVRAREYLVDRGFTEATLDRFGIGLAPHDWEALSRRLAARGFTSAELVAAGISSPSRRGGVYDRFRGRITIPIRDASGRAIGVGGRLLPDGGDGPKYLNSPATELFDKSRTLFGLNLARPAIRREGVTVIVEGYTDVLAAHQAGFENVVASLGTALTAGQVALATRYADAIALAYDVDVAGEAATERGLLDELGPDASVAKVRVVRIPSGKDPDELIRTDAAAWRRAVVEAKPVIEYFMEREAAHHDLGTVSGRRDLTGRVLALLRRVGDPLERAMYLQQLARLVGVEERLLADALARSPVRSRQRQPATDGSPAAEAVRLGPVEREALALILRYPEVAADADAAGPLPFNDGAALALLDAWRAWRAEHEGDGLKAFVESVDAPVGDRAREVLDLGPGGAEARLSAEDARAAFRVCLLRMRAERLDEAIRDGRLLLDEAAREGDRSRLHDIEHEIDRLGRQKAEVTRAMHEPAGPAGERRT